MTRALVVLNDKSDRDKVARWAYGVPDGTRVEFKPPKRSLPQNDRMWAMLTDVAAHMKRAHAKNFTTDQWKAIFMHACGREVSFLPSLDGQTFIPWGQSSSDLGVKEMTDLIEFMFAWGAENGVIFNEPQDNPNSATADQSPSGQSPDNDEDRPASSQEDGGDGIPRTGSSPSSTISLDEYRDHFIDFARKALTTASDANLDQNARMEAIEGYVLSYREVIPESLWQKLSGVKMPVLYVVTGQRTVEQARSYIARDLLECSVQEIGG